MSLYKCCFTLTGIKPALCPVSDDGGGGGRPSQPLASSRQERRQWSSRPSPRVSSLVRGCTIVQPMQFHNCANRATWLMCSGYRQRATLRCPNCNLQRRVATITIYNEDLSSEGKVGRSSDRITTSTCKHRMQMKRGYNYDNHLPRRYIRQLSRRERLRTSPPSRRFYCTGSPL